MNFINRTSLGIKRCGWKLLAYVFAGFSMAWTVVESLLELFPSVKLEGYPPYLGLVFSGLIFAWWRIFPSKKATIRLKNTNTSVEVVFGDIFRENGHKVIPVNEYFDSEIGDPVSPLSLHGKFIQEVLDGRSSILDELVDTRLNAVPHELVPRHQGRDKKFQIGTTLVHDATATKYFLVALSRTDTETLKAKADVPDLWQALSGLWDKVRLEAGGSPVNIPLIGSGLSGVGLPPQQLLQIIMVSILDATKKREITPEIRIVLHEHVFEHIQLDLIKKEWR